MLLKIGVLLLFLGICCARKWNLEFKNKQLFKSLRIPKVSNSCWKSKKLVGTTVKHGKTVTIKTKEVESGSCKNAKVRWLNFTLGTGHTVNITRFSNRRCKVRVAFIKGKPARDYYVPLCSFQKKITVKIGYHGPKAFPSIHFKTVDESPDFEDETTMEDEDLDDEEVDDDYGGENDDREVENDDQEVENDDREVENDDQEVENVDQEVENDDQEAEIEDDDAEVEAVEVFN